MYSMPACTPPTLQHATRSNCGQPCDVGQPLASPAQEKGRSHTVASRSTRFARGPLVACVGLGLLKIQTHCVGSQFMEKKFATMLRGPALRAAAAAVSRCWRPSASRDLCTSHAYVTSGE